MPQLLLIAGLSLFFVFAIRVAAKLMLFQLLEPGWLLGMVNGVLGSSVYPILGVALIYLQVDDFSLSFAWVFTAFSQWSHSDV